MTGPICRSARRCATDGSTPCSSAAIPPSPTELAYYLVYAPAGTPPAGIVRAAGCRWAIKDVFKLAKRRAGLDDYEVRSWTGWHRHTTLALLALDILAVTAAEKGSLAC